MNEMWPCPYCHKRAIVNADGSLRVHMEYLNEPEQCPGSFFNIHKPSGPEHEAMEIRRATRDGER